MTDNRNFDNTVVGAGSTQSGIDYQPGQIVGGDYRLVDLLGRGGMGTVYTAEHRYIRGKLYALKLLAADQITESNLKRFQREAVALARLSHPGVVQIYNFGIDRDVCPYYVMEIVEGISLADLLKQSGPMDEFRALDLFIQVADALDYAHRNGIVHRDIKPSNLMLVQQKNDLKAQIKIVDFGIVRLVIDDKEEKQKLTATGDIFGTPLYMSPEQTVGAPVTFASDVYSLGCTLFEVLTGRPPFKGPNAFATLELHQSARPIALADACPDRDYSGAVESIVARMLAKRPEDRYASMHQLSRDLTRAQEGKSVYAAGLSLEEVEEPLFVDDDSEVDPVAQVKSEQKRWLVPVAILSSLVLAGVALLLWSHPAAPIKPVEPISIAQAHKLVSDDINDFAATNQVDGLSVSTYETSDQFKKAYAHINKPIIAVSLNSGRPLPEYSTEDHATESDTGKLYKAIDLLRDVKKLDSFKLSNSVLSSQAVDLNQDDIKALERAPLSKEFFLSNLRAPLAAFMQLHYLKTVDKIILRDFYGSEPQTNAESTSYILDNLASLGNLKHLVLHRYTLSAGDIDRLCRMRSLRNLELNDTQLPLEAIYKLTHNSKLEALIVPQSSYSPAEMRKVLPGCTVKSFVIGSVPIDRKMANKWTMRAENSIRKILPGFFIINRTDTLP